MLEKPACLVCGGKLGVGTAPAQRVCSTVQPTERTVDPATIVEMAAVRQCPRMAESIDLATRIERLSARASTAPSSDRLLAEIEDLLAVGYLEALAEEARGRRLAERWEHLAENLDEQDAALEIRRIAVQRRGIDARVALLRDRLGVLRAQFAQLRATSPPA